MTIIAIDPGKSGGIATQTHSHAQGEAGTQKAPATLPDLAQTLLNIKIEAEIYRSPLVCYIEEVPSFAGKNRPGSSMFNLGKSFGEILGTLTALKIRTILVRPQKWQRFFGLGKRSECASDTEWKNKLKAEAQRRYPTQTVTLATSDALLLLDYAIAQERNNNPKP